MNDILRSTIYTGLGAMVLARKKFEEYVEELIQNNQLTQDDGKRLVQEFIQSLEDGRNLLESNVISRVDELLLTLKLPARHEIEVFVHEWKQKLSNHSLEGFDKKER